MTTFFSLAPGVDAEPILAPFIDRGQFVVFMHHDPAETDNGLQPATIVGMVGAADRYACGVLIAQIQRALGGGRAVPAVAGATATCCVGRAARRTRSRR